MLAFFDLKGATGYCRSSTTNECVGVEEAYECTEGGKENLIYFEIFIKPFL